MLTPVPHVRSVVDQDGTVILDIRHDTMLTLNATGGYIWERLEQGKLIDEIIRDLSRDTGTDIVLIEHEVHEFLEQLKAKHLLVEAAPSRLSGLFRRAGRVP